MLNKATIIGNVGKDPEIKSLNDGGKIARFSLACSERWTDKSSGEKKEKTEWINVVVFGPLAGVVDNYVKKGTKLYVEGKIQTRKWQDQAGNDRYSTEVVLQGFDAKLIMLSKSEGGGERRDKSEDDGTWGASSKPSQSEGKAKPKYSALDDEIPF